MLSHALFKLVLILLRHGIQASIVQFIDAPEGKLFAAQIESLQTGNLAISEKVNKYSKMHHELRISCIQKTEINKMK